MPTYEYICDACEHTFDEFQYFSEEPLKKCPECKKLKLRRAFGTGAAVLFKGSGFYETDYRSESYKSGAKADSDSTKPAGTDAKAESKDSTITKADAKPSGETGKSSKSSKGGKAK